MPTKQWDKSRLPSRHVTVGPDRAPHRSYYYAMGLTEEEIAQPFVGVATCWNEAAPCNIALSRQAQSVKRGVKEAGGTPREFTTITVTDGIAMGHQGMKSSLVVARPDRRFGRTHGARALLRRAGRPGRLRQVAAGHDDGDGAAERAERVHVRRLDPAGQIQGPRRDRGGRVRGGRPARRGQRWTMRTCTNWNASPARRRVRAAGSSRRTRWRWCRKRSGWRCPVRPARRRRTRIATAGRWNPGARSWR